MIRLFHRTTTEGADAIPREGFRDGEDGGVWFSEYLDCWGEQGRHLLVVEADLSRDELATFAHDAISDEVWDDEAGRFIPDPTGLVERFVWFKIPAATINPRSTVRLVIDRIELLALAEDDG